MKRRVFTPEPRPHDAGLRESLAAAEARVAELTQHAADLHQLIGRGSHGGAVMDFKCAVSVLHDILQASRENSENNARLEEQITELEIKTGAFEAESNQRRVTTWVREVFSEAEATNAPERSLRAAEEVIELTQACGVPATQVHLLVDYVYARPVGDPAKEIAGCMLTIYAAASALGVDAQAEFETEIARVQQPEVIERVLRRQTEKREALATPSVRALLAICDCNDWTHVGYSASAYRDDDHHPDCPRRVSPVPEESLPCCPSCGSTGVTHIANCPALRA